MKSERVQDTEQFEILYQENGSSGNFGVVSGLRTLVLKHHWLASEWASPLARNGLVD